MKNILRLLILTWIGCCIISSQSHAQSYNLRPTFFPPSPNAVGLGRYGEVEVGIHSGTPSIAIPLTTLSGRQLSVPIGLSYYATGVKPMDNSGWVGLNWSLLAGGVITRAVVGISDESSQGLYTRILNNSNSNPVIDPPHFGTLAYKQDLDEGVVDGMPDNFVYNFQGMSGQLGYNDSGEFYALRDQNMKIIAHPLDGGDEIWELIDGNGIRYIFGASGTSNQQGVGHSNITNGGQFEYVETNFVSSWYLTKIISADGTDEITLEYSNDTENYTASFPYWVDSYPYNWYPFDISVPGGDCHIDNSI